MSTRVHILTGTFLVASSLWFVAMRYSPPSFYGPLSVAFGVLIAALVVGVIFLLSRRTSPWRAVGLVVAAMAVFEAFWRFYLSPSAWDAFKLTSIVLDIGAPLIVLLGVAALVASRRNLHST